MSDEEPKSIPIMDLVSEDGAHQLATSPNMRPYLRTDNGGASRPGHYFSHRRDHRLTAGEALRLASSVSIEVGLPRPGGV